MKEKKGVTRLFFCCSVQFIYNLHHKRRYETQTMSKGGWKRSHSWYPGITWYKMWCFSKTRCLARFIAWMSTDAHIHSYHQKPEKQKTCNQWALISGGCPPLTRNRLWPAGTFVPTSRDVFFVSRTVEILNDCQQRKLSSRFGQNRFVRAKTRYHLGTLISNTTHWKHLTVN